MKKTISYSLFGSDPKYCMGLLLNVPLRDKYFPDWEIICYYNETVPKYIVDEANILGIKMLKTDSTVPGTFWRFFVADTDTDIFIVRDVDDRLNHLQKEAVDEFINSDCQLHLIKCHIGHYNEPIMGGLWGAKKGLIVDIQKQIVAYPHHNNIKSDQNFLRSIYEQHKNVTLTHGIKPFPSKKFILIPECTGISGVHEWYMIISEAYNHRGKY